MKEFKFVLIVAIGILVVIFCYSSYNYFYEPYPCSSSGVGCSSIKEFIFDVYIPILSMFGMIGGFILIIYSIYFLAIKDLVFSEKVKK